MPNDDKRVRVTAICRRLPGAEHRDQGDHTIYRVRGKVFAYFLDNHHGDGIVSVCVKSQLGENLDRARLEPERFYLPAYIGPRGWFGAVCAGGRSPRSSSRATGSRPRRPWSGSSMALPASLG